MFNGRVLFEALPFLLSKHFDFIDILKKRELISNRLLQGMFKISLTTFFGFFSQEHELNVNFINQNEFLRRGNEKDYFFMCFVFNRMWRYEICQNSFLCGYESLSW